ncbi:MAG TPA: family 20 glycosylhydrolase [Gemmatimonadaceae bacterium]|nr:family 20 glycosylhydrolase [Gemmatimonadaceae bacterium]
MRSGAARGIGFAVMAGVAACNRPTTNPTPVFHPPIQAVVPVPATIDISPADSFVVTPRTVVYVDPDASTEVQAIGDFAAQLIASRFGATAQRLTSAVPDSSIRLTLDPTRTNLGDEGYELNSTRTQVIIVAARPAGLFYGVQTMRQLFPPSIEHLASYTRRLAMPAAHVVDTPRFGWRGGMLDVSRHFLPAADVKRFIDLYALYKLNRLHLHLADDQGWRIQINSWPRLTAVSGGTAIGDAPAGFYTQQEYADIVAYARSRYITVVPEIDMPGHSNAALMAYPDLKCDRVAPAAFTRLGGPPNSLCVTRDSVYQFVGDVVREFVAMAPTPYFHIGGDEVQGMSKADYSTFVTRVQDIVTSAGPRMIGWGEIAPVTTVSPNTIVQHWTNDSVGLHAARGGKIIMSPGPHAYLDMQYDSSSSLGLHWAGRISLESAYDWNPGTLIPGVSESSVLGVEGPLWAETLITRQDYEYMEFPRLAALAELGWSPASKDNWADFRRRMAVQGARLAALGVNFARAPGVDWRW